MSAHIAKRPELVCGCLHDNVVSREEDSELRLALIRGVEETGVPSIQYAWVPQKPHERVSRPSTSCRTDARLHVRALSVQAQHEDGATA